MKRRTIFYAILVAGVIALFVVRMELRVAGEFVMLPAHNSDVRAGVEGIIEEINVEEGDVVKKGDVVARLSGRDNDAELRKITAAIDEKQAQVRLLKAGVRIEEIELAKTQIGKAEERLKYAQKNYDIEKALYEKNIQSKKEFQRTEELVAVTQKELEEARDHLKVLRAGNRPEQIEAAEAELRSLEAQRHYLEEQFRLLTVVSPNDGIITTHKPKEKLGQHVAKGDLIATVHDLRKITAEIAVPEKEIADVHPGQPVELKARSFPQESFSGTVIAVAPTATMHEAGGGERSISVTTEIDNRNLLLKSGMSGNAKILCGEHKAIELLTRRIVRFIRVEFWSWW
jgi:multidrug resistance efflux pump